MSAVYLYEVHGDVLPYLINLSLTSKLLCYFEPDYTSTQLLRFCTHIDANPIQEYKRRIINSYGEPGDFSVPWLIPFNHKTINAFKLLKLKSLPHDIIICDELFNVIFYRFHENPCDFLYSELPFNELSSIFKSCCLIQNIMSTPVVELNKY